jgi:hypothetical protein
MSYYLRVECVNLSFFIDDTNDLSTTRGGGLLLLEAMEMVEGVIEKLSPIKAAISEGEILQLENKLKELKQSKSNKTTKKKIKKIEAELEKTNQAPQTSTITKGASWGLFELEVNDQLAGRIKKKWLMTLMQVINTNTPPSLSIYIQRMKINTPLCQNSCRL